MSLPITTTWSHLRTVIDNKHLPVQYEYNPDGYQIFAIDNNVIYQTVVYNNSVPDPSLYSQVQNDADKADFLLNYQPGANHIMQAFAARDGYTVTTYPLLIGGKDGGGLARIFATDTSGRGVMVGAGTAGTPVGGVFTIQGDPAGAPIPISGSITATNPSVSTNNAAAPASSTQIGGTDGTNLQSVHVYDTDSGGGTQYTLGVNLRKSSSGGSVELGTATDPIRVDPTGTTTQPVSGTVTANIGTTGGLALDATLTGGTQTTRITDGTNTATVKAASTAAVATDKALVVAISPNNSVVVTQPTAANLNAQVQGVAADGTAVTGNPVLMGGQDGTNVQSILTDTTGRTVVVGGAANGAAVSGSPVRIGVSDGANTRDALSDTSGRQIVVGAAADGAAVTGNPILMAGQDGTNAQSILTDTTGRQVMIGAAADGAAVTGNPILMGGQDGTNAQSILTDTTGRQVIVGGAADGAPPSGNPVLIAGWDGTNVVRLKLNTDGTLATSDRELATFTAISKDTAIANNKSMFSIVNASGSTVTAKISAIYITSVQTTTVSGVIGTFELHRIVNHSAGTTITAIETMDTTDSLNGSITVRTGSTVTTESANLLWRAIFSTDEYSANSAIDNAFGGHIFTTMFPVWNRKDKDNKPIVLRANEGLTVKFATNSTAGTFDVMVIFTQE